MSGRPNVLIFMPDSLRADAVGAFGSRVAHTPNIDALAARGTAFMQTFSQHSVCSPSRVSMQTGWYPHVGGHRTLDHLIQPWEPSMLRIFSEGGYSVGWVGRVGDTFAEGLVDDYCDFAGLTVRPQRKEPVTEPHGVLGTTNSFYAGRLEAGRVDLDEAATQTAIAWLTEPPPEPWLLFCTLADPHPPFEVADPWFSMHDRASMPDPVPLADDGKPSFMKLLSDSYELARLERRDWAEIAAVYHGMVSRVDDMLGRVLTALDASGAGERTVIVFHTDHGEYLGDFGLVEKWPSGLDPCLLHNPLMIAAPGMPAGEQTDALVEMIDVLPTLLELCELQARHTHFGRSLVALLTDPTLPHRDAIYAEGGHRTDEPHVLEGSGAPGVYQRKAQLQQDHPEAVGKAVALRTHAHTYVMRAYEGDEFYDRVADPNEMTNVAGSSPDVERDLRDAMLDWLVTTADVVPWTGDARFDPAVYSRLPDR